jgi:hypothetical protein
MGDYATDSVGGAGQGTGPSGGSALVCLTPAGQQYLGQTRPWLRFMSIVAFAMAGLMVIVGVVMLLVGVFGGLASRNAGIAGPMNGLFGLLVGALYIGMAPLYVLPGLYLARYASALRLLEANASAATFEDALKHQRAFWRFVGILTAVGLTIAVVIFGLAFGLGLAAALLAGRS